MSCGKEFTRKIVLAGIISFIGLNVVLLPEASRAQYVPEPCQGVPMGPEGFVLDQPIKSKKVKIEGLFGPTSAKQQCDEDAEAQFNTKYGNNGKFKGMPGKYFMQALKFSVESKTSILKSLSNVSWWIEERFYEVGATVSGQYFPGSYEAENTKVSYGRTELTLAFIENRILQTWCPAAISCLKTLPESDDMRSELDDNIGVYCH